MTPMSLERAVEVAIEVLEWRAVANRPGLCTEAAAKLRDALPWMKDCEAAVLDYLKDRPNGIPYSDHLRKIVDSYRAFKEASK